MKVLSRLNKITASKIPSEDTVNLLFEDTGYAPLDNSHEQSFSELTQPMILTMINHLKRYSVEQWAEINGISEKEAKKDLDYYNKLLSVWFKKKIEEEKALKEIYDLTVADSSLGFKHDKLVKAMEQYLKDWK